jgi:FtsP/CotA-like multicopper oxidase with cupredoxin domain
VERRDFLTHLGAGLAFAWWRPASGQSPTFSPNVELELRAAPGTVAIVPGAGTRVWRYEGRLIQGPQGTLQPVPGSYLGPILRFTTGQRVRVHFINDLPEASIIHWHGLDVPTQADGHPRLAVGTGQRYVYEFEVINRAGTYWYHPHPHMRTAYQAYHGLAGLILVSDPTEAALKLPSGSDELVCVIQDRQLDAGNQLVYVSGMMMDAMNGFVGDRVLVNGRPGAMSLATRAYRLRLMNGSNSRVYKLAWGPSTPITVIGTDGGLLEKPVTRSYVTLAPGERVDTILDLTGKPVGARLTLRSLGFPSRMFTMQMGIGGMMGARGMGRGRGRMGGGTLPQGVSLAGGPVHLRCRVACAGDHANADDQDRLPAHAVPARRPNVRDAGRDGE